MSALADMLEARHEELIQRWTDRVRRELAPGGASRIELVDHLPDYLRDLRAALRSTPPRSATSAEPGGRAVARAHGAQRFRIGFDLDALVREYGVLREFILDLVEEENLPVRLDEMRRLTGFLTEGIAEAVSEHGRREQASRIQEARERESRLESLFLQAPAAIAIIRGPRLVIELANPLVCRLWGRIQEQVQGRPLLEAMPELVGQGFDELLHGVMATGVAFVGKELSARLVRTPGASAEDGYFDFVYEALRDEAGRIDGVLVVATDVTRAVLARRELEVALARAEAAEQSRSALMAALTEQSFVGVAYLRGPQHRFEVANPGYEQLVGKHGVVGKTLLEALPELEGQGLDTLLDGVLQTGEPYMAQELAVQVDMREQGGMRERLYDFVYQPVRGPEGRVEGVLHLVIDVTEKVQVRREATRLAQEQGVRLEFEQQLIGIVSHDLRNPLSVILFGVQALLRREDLDPRIAKTVVRIQSSAERATRMVRDLLDFTQARLGGGLRVERRPTNLSEVTRTAVEEVQATCPERELRLEVREELRGAWDGDRLAQVVGNLVSNAVKYSPEGTLVTVRLVGRAGGVLLEVHNEGSPIPAEARARLFQPLQRAVSTLDKAGRSVGLGLYIVQQVMLAHGGSVHVTSDEAHGTTFRAWLPAAP